MNHIPPIIYKEYGKINTDNLLPLLEKHKNSEMWNDTFRQTYYSSHTSTENLPIVWTPVLNQEYFSVFNNTELLDSDIGKIYQEITIQVLNLIPGTIIRGSIIRMNPQSTIPYHIDGTHPVWTKCHRIHLPIITESEVRFHYKWIDENKSIVESSKHLQKNILVEINNCIPHGVSHQGYVKRYHLVYDILPQNLTDDFRIVAHSNKDQFNIERMREITERLQFLNILDRSIYKF